MKDSGQSHCSKSEHSFILSFIQYSFIAAWRRSDVHTQIWPALIIQLRYQACMYFFIHYSFFILHVTRGLQVGGTPIFSGILKDLAMRAWHFFVFYGHIVTEQALSMARLAIISGLALPCTQIGLILGRSNPSLIYHTIL